MKCLASIFAKFSPSQNNHVYSILFTIHLIYKQNPYKLPSKNLHDEWLFDPKPKDLVIFHAVPTHNLPLWCPGWPWPTEVGGASSALIVALLSLSTLRRLPCEALSGLLAVRFCGKPNPDWPGRSCDGPVGCNISLSVLAASEIWTSVMSLWKDQPRLIGQVLWWPSGL